MIAIVIFTRRDRSYGTLGGPLIQAELELRDGLPGHTDKP
jgi:hypothetical protein